MNITDILKHIKETIKSYGKSQVDIANDCLFCEQGNVSNKLSGKTSLSLENAISIADYLGVSLDELCGYRPTISDDNNISLSVLFRYLFKVFSLGNFTLEEEHSENKNGYIAKRYILYSTNPNIQKLMEEWKELESIPITNSMREFAIHEWQNRVLSAYKDNYRSIGYFDNLAEYQHYTEEYPKRLKIDTEDLINRGYDAPWLVLDIFED